MSKKNGLPRYVYEDIDQYGKVRLYFRRAGQRKILIDAKPLTAEFWRLYAQASAGEAPAKPTERRRQPTTSADSLQALCRDYCGSADYKTLDTSTRRVRKLILDAICREPWGDDPAVTFGGAPVTSLTENRIRRLRDRKAETPEAANGWIKALRQVFKWGRTMWPIIQINPAKDVEYLKGRAGGVPPWDEEDIQKYVARHPPGTKAALALALLLFTGQRRSDVVKLGKQHLKRGELTFTQVKNGRRKPVTLTIPVHPTLAQFISRPPVGDMQFLVTESGRPFTSNGFGNWFHDRCREAGVEKSAHGCRKTAAAILADIGCSTLQIAAITGHRSLKEVERYTRSANQKRLARAAMSIWSGGQTGAENAQGSEGVADPWAKTAANALIYKAE